MLILHERSGPRFASDLYIELTAAFFHLGHPSTAAMVDWHYKPFSTYTIKKVCTEGLLGEKSLAAPRT